MGTTPSNVNYMAATKRHREDADLLYNDGRYPNAGHLYGFHAECALKAVLVAFGASIEDGSPYRVHIDRLIPMFTVFPDGRIATKYSALMPSLTSFSNWRVAHRYWRDSLLPKATVDQWKNASTEVENMIQEAIRDGVRV